MRGWAEAQDSSCRSQESLNLATARPGCAEGHPPAARLSGVPQSQGHQARTDAFTPPNSPQELKLVVGPRPPFETLSVGTPGRKADPSLPAWWARSPLADSSLRDDHPSLKAGSGWGTSVPAPVPSAAVGILFFALPQLLFPVSAAPPSAGRAKAVSPAPPTSERARAAPSAPRGPFSLEKLNQVSQEFQNPWLWGRGDPVGTSECSCQRAGW